MTVPKPITKRKNSGSERVYLQLKQMITSFELYPGSRITEHELAAKFNISRTPIRQALQRLEVEGFLTIRPKQGCFIRELDINELTEYYEARIAIEQLIVEAACHNMSDKLIQDLMQEWDPSHHDADMVQGVDLGEKDESFHLRLAQGSAKPVLTEILVSINNRIRIIRRLDLNAERRSERTYQEHYELLGLILQRDVTKAKTYIKRHIQRSKEFAKTLTLTALARKKSLS
jgi:DNA-binding GntR family transcriptional regulator